MKKLLAILAFVLCLTSCQKIKTSLDGTSWSRVDYLTDINANMHTTISFTGSAFTIEASVPSLPKIEHVYMYGTYDYSFPNVYLTSEGETVKAVVADDFKSITFEGGVFLRDK